MRRRRPALLASAAEKDVDLAEADSELARTILQAL
jgi:hypothetical protein